MNITQEQLFDICSQTATYDSRGILVLRRGQNMFSRLYRINPHLAGHITNTEFDPFYLDSNIRRFMDELVKFVK